MKIVRRSLGDSHQILVSNWNQVVEYDSAKILWDSSVHTDHKLEHHKPDIITVNKETKE